MKYRNTTGCAIWGLLTDYCYCEESSVQGKKIKQKKRSGKRGLLTVLRGTGMKGNTKLKGIGR